MFLFIIGTKTRKSSWPSVGFVSSFSKNSAIAASFWPFVLLFSSTGLLFVKLRSVDFQNGLGLRVGLRKPPYKAVYLRSSFKIQYKLAAVKRILISFDLEILFF